MMAKIMCLLEINDETRGSNLNFCSSTRHQTSIILRKLIIRFECIHVKVVWIPVSVINIP